jgi:hypothetical protein
LGLVHHGGFRFGQLDLGGGKTILGLGADIRNLVARLSGGGAQQLFGVGDHQLYVGNQLVLGDIAHVAHALLLNK